MSALLDRVRTPADVRALPAGELPALAQAVRDEIVASVARTGGHLASSLGAVELSIGLLRVFDPCVDRIVWDVGHQTYAWKLLTGRRDSFGTLRSYGGLSGFSNPDETDCDAFVSGHAGNALAAAEGLAAARGLKGGSSHVVAVVGDASLANGESLEALNNCAQLKGRVVLVVNDNAMSISRNVGSFARVLGRLISGRRYNRVKAAAERAGHRLHLTFLRRLYHRLESVFKSIWLGNAFFESFGLRYVGPVDGHDLKAVEQALAVARDDKRSVVVHIVTVKGRGFAPAERNPTAWHGVGAFDPVHPVDPQPCPACWSGVFGSAVAALARADGRICALTAAMRDGTGLTAFAEEFPTRFFDCGICEEQMVTFAAGLARGGLRPIVAIYASFLQRAVDQVMHDVCLLGLPVVFGVDRAGCVGADGRTHHGMFDIAMLRCLPGLSILQPRDGVELADMLAAAVGRNAPVAVRYPRGTPPPAAAGRAPLVWGKAEPLLNPAAKLQLWALGDEVPKALRVAELLAARGVTAGVVNARFVKPFDAELLAAQRAAGARIVSIENGSVQGGFGEAIAADAKFGWPDRFVGHGTVARLEQAHRFTAEDIAEAL
ncbi:MAG: 1-deoxy-D-xylulose-5-phosphate synthase [Kiritimatiellia bacterium]